MSSRVFRTLAEAQGQFGPAALAIGNFDGVHVGHQALISNMAQYADAHALRRAVLTFHPHPTVLIAPDRVPPMLCSLDDRLAYLEQLGVERILVLPFTPELSRFTPVQFVAEVLADALNTKATFAGENFHFGYRQAGTPAVLTELGTQYGFYPTFVRPVTYKGSVISSSAIRAALTQQRTSYAGRLMGRWFSTVGPVVKGQGIGSRQTVPTLNILPSAGQLILPGVYITRVFDTKSGHKWPAITNVGARPTFQGEGLTIESFLLSPLEGKAPADIRVEFRRFVRAERAFESPQALRQQIIRDVSRAQAYWRRIDILKPKLILE